MTINRGQKALGSARVSRVRQSDGLVVWRAGDCVLAIADFARKKQGQDRFGETPKPTRETRALPK